MGTIHTTWSVRRDHRVTPADLGPDGRVRDAAVDRWVTDALGDFLEQCHELERLRLSRGLERREHVRPAANAPCLPTAPTVMVTATATEVFPESFLVAVRVRPVGGDDDRPLDARASVELVDPRRGEAQELGDAVRDELIALARVAGHYG